MSPGGHDITRAERKDWPAIREICCLTGKAGEPIPKERWPFFSEHWVGPYERLAPEWGYVYREGAANDSRVVGYLTGAKDTRALERKKRWLLGPMLALGIGLGKFARNEDARRFLRRWLGFEKDPSTSFRLATAPYLAREYPAHLHINFRADCRGGGRGRALIDRYCADLGAAGVTGVHVFCGANPSGFYAKAGFGEIERIEYRPGVFVYCYGRKI